MSVGNNSRSCSRGGSGPHHERWLHGDRGLIHSISVVLYNVFSEEARQSKDRFWAYSAKVARDIDSCNRQLGT